MSNTIGIIQQAIIANKKVVITYNGKKGREIDPLSITRSTNGNVIFTGHEIKSGETRSFKLESITVIKLGESRRNPIILTPENKTLILQLPKESSSLAEALPLTAGIERFALSPQEAEARKLKALSDNSHVNEVLAIIEGTLEENISRKAKVYVEDEDRFLRVLEFDYLSTTGELKAVDSFYPESVAYSQNTDNVVISGYIAFEESKISEYRSYNVENINNLQSVEKNEGDIEPPYTPATSLMEAINKSPYAKLLRILTFTGGALFLFLMYFIINSDM